MSNNSQYKYEEMSNKVLRQDRRAVNRGEAKGTPESLAGKVSMAQMGSRRGTTDIPKDDRPRKRPVRRRAQDQDGSYDYNPTTEATGQTFDLIMAWTQELLEDASHEVLRTSVDDILKVTHSEKRDRDKHSEVNEILSVQVPDEKFNQLLNLSRQLTDFNDREDGGGVDNEEGIAIQFDDEDEEESSDEELDEGEDEDDVEEIEEFGADELPEQQVEILAKSKKEDDINIPAEQIDAFYLQRAMKSVVNDDRHAAQELSQKVHAILKSEASLGEAENQLMELFDFEHAELVEKLCHNENRQKIVWLVEYQSASTGPEREAIEAQMKSAGVDWIMRELQGESGSLQDGKEQAMDVDVDESENQKQTHDGSGAAKYLPQEINLNAYVVDDSISSGANHVLGSRGVRLPENTTRIQTKSYEQYTIPPPAAPKDDTKRVAIKSMPEWTHPAFPFDELNRIQSVVYPTAFGSDENMLVCAPTGAGKTNVALLTILQTIQNYRLENGDFDLANFKIIYIAPLKALVQEQVKAFSERLAPFGIRVEELTGDRNMTKQQIAETQMIVTTPEKWDVITRKASDVSYTNLVRLIILDEIHLLHDPRGPVLESIVSRALRRYKATNEWTRLVGLSATLPNYKDVATFLRVQEETGLYFFDSQYRPCPLLQKFIGITEKKPSKQIAAMNSACYDKVMEYAGKEQMIIFVHSRKDTAKTAKYLSERALEENTLTQFLPSLQARESLKQLSEQAKGIDLKNLLPMGFAIHHAGMTREDRVISEQAFADGLIQVLVSTATLAWGVNLPAHTVIIKGTQVYSPEKGRWDRLSPQDTLQMLGRAGRPQYDRFGEGIIITRHTDLDFYMSLMTAQLDIESQLGSKLPDSLNAEVVLGTVSTLDEAVEWLKYTYLYVRMLRSPTRYHVGDDHDDKFLTRHLINMAHTALLILERDNMVKYDQRKGLVQSTDMGQISSHFYISHSSMANYNKLLHPLQTPIDVFRVFSSSEEFKYIPVRSEEKVELSRLLENAPIPVKETVEQPAAKINVLLQAYISRLKLDGFAMVVDMVYITQSAGRLLRSMFEMCLKKGWSSMAKMALDLCKMVERRMWLSNSPFRQFSGCPSDIIRRAEASQMPWPRYFDLKDPAEVGQAIRNERYGKLVYDLLTKFPRLGLEAQFQPITKELLRVELTIKSEFIWDNSIHGAAESFIVIVEDTDGERILYTNTFVLRGSLNDVEHVLDFTVPITDPMSPNYFVSLISERWLHCESRVALAFQNLVLPELSSKVTPLHNLQPLQVEPALKPYFAFDTFNAMQSQVFQTLYNTDHQTFIGSAVGNGKTVCAELALLRFWQVDYREGLKAVYIAPHQDQVDVRLKDWQSRFSAVDKEQKVINKLTGELSRDLQILASSDLILATPIQWDVMSRRWRRRPNVRKVDLLICDDVHAIGGLNGYIYELVITRARYMAEQLQNEARIVALSNPLADTKDISSWIGAKRQVSVYNFAATERINALDSVQMQAFNIPHHPSMMIAMAKPVYYALVEDLQLQSLVYVHDRRQCVSSADELVAWSLSRRNQDFRSSTAEELPMVDRISDNSLKDSLSKGIGYLYGGMDPDDKKLVLHYYSKKLVNVVMITPDMCWTAPSADQVIVMGTQLYDGSSHRYVDYPIIDLLQMIGNAAQRPHGKVLIVTNTSKKAYYTKFIQEPLPIESHLDASMADAFIPEINEGIITSPQDAVDWLGYSFYYKRMYSNPSYYGMTSTSEEDVSLHLSSLVEDTLEELSQAELIEVDEEEEENQIQPANGAAIAAYYNILFSTMQIFALSLKANTSRRGLLEIITSATEFESLPMRTKDSKQLLKIFDAVHVQLDNIDTRTPRFKAFVLTQAHMARIKLQPDFVSDQRIILEKLLQLVSAAVEVLSSEGHLNALKAMDLSQMIVQAMWHTDSPLKQIPFIDDAAVSRCKTEGISTVRDFINIEDDDLRLRLLGFTEDNEDELSEVADFVNNYPIIDKLTYEHEDENLVAEEPATLYVTINREEDEEEEEEFDQQVKCQFYPYPKTESWWLVVGDEQQRELYGIKKVTPNNVTETFKLSYTLPKPGHYNLKLYCVSDSYVDADLEVEFSVDAAVGDGADADGDVDMGQ